MGNGIIFKEKKNGENGIIMVLLENLFDDENICSYVHVLCSNIN